MNSADVKWYVVHTKARREDLAAASVARLGIEVLLPKMTCEKHANKGYGPVVKPLFPGYMFARFEPASYLLPIRYARGVRGIVSCGGIPVPLDHEIVESIRSKTSKSGVVRRRESYLKRGDGVIVRRGILRGFSGVFDSELNDYERVVILLSTVSYQAKLVIDQDSVVKVGKLAVGL
jgi:transcriptional antiterminator RfaH